MKALSIKQPWVDLIISGNKIIETRTWKTDYRGELLVCSSKSIDKNALEYFKYLFPPDHEFLTGKAMAIVNLKDCSKMTIEDEDFALCEYYNAYSWLFGNVRKINKPFDVKGQLGLFEVQYG